MSMNMLTTTKMFDERTIQKTVVLPLLDDLYRVALHLTHSSLEAEELMAETVARACENIATLRDLTRARQWLLRILTNAFLNSCRSKKRRQQISFVELDDDDDATPFSLFEALMRYGADEGNPERIVNTKLMDEEIQSALAALPEEYRTAVVLCDVEGYAYAEVAVILDVPIGTVRSRLSRGRGFLQKKLYHYAKERGWVVLPHQLPNGKTNDGSCACEKD